MGKAKRFNRYDETVKSARERSKSFGVERQNLSGIGSTFRSAPLPPIITTKSASSQGGISLGPEFPDNLFRIFDDIDNTRKIAFQAGGIAASTTRTLTIQNADGVVALLDGSLTQIFSGINEFIDDKFLIRDDIDNTRKLKFQTGGIATSTTRTWTAQDASGTIPLLDGAAGTQNFANAIEMAGATFDVNGNDFILDADADSKFVTSVDDVLSLNLGGAVEFLWTTTSWDITDKFQNMSEITIPSNPGTNAGRFYAKDTGGKTHPFWLESDGEEHDLTLGGLGGGGSKTFAKVVKTADEIVNNSIVLQDDDELRFSGVANKNYSFVLTIFVQAASSTPDFQTAFTLPSGATGEWTTTSLTSDTAGLTADITTADVHTVLSSTPPRHIIYEGVIRMGSTAGVCQLQWAQAIADASNTTVEIGSKLLVYEEGTDPSADAGNSFIFTKIVKTVDETVNNTTTVQNDDELFFTVNANTTYSIKMILYIDSGQNPGFKWKFTLPTSATGERTNSDISSSGTQATLDVTTEDSIGTGSGVRFIVFYIRLIVGSSAGTVQLQWAQDFAQMEDTKLLAGSTLLVYEGGLQTATNPIVTGKFPIFFDQRSLSTATNETLASPLVLAKWQIVPPAGLTENNDIGIHSGNITTFMRRVSGSSTGTLALLDSNDGTTYTAALLSTTSTDAGFTKKNTFDNDTSVTDARRFLAVALYDTGGDSVIAAREIHFDAQLVLPPGYDLIQLI